MVTSSASSLLLLSPLILAPVKAVLPFVVPTISSPASTSSSSPSSEAVWSSKVVLTSWITSSAVVSRLVYLMLLLVRGSGLCIAPHEVRTSRMLLLLVTKPGRGLLLMLTRCRSKLLLLQQQVGSRRRGEVGDSGVSEGLWELGPLAKRRRPPEWILSHILL